MMDYYVVCKEISKIHKAAGDEEVRALIGIDLGIEKGEMVAIVGSTGAGKSSLLNLLGGLDRPDSGELTVGGENLKKFTDNQLTQYRLNKVGFVWQNVSRNLVPYRNVLDNIQLPMELAGKLGRNERFERAKELLKAVQMEEFQEKRLEELSGGEQQRVAIAVALSNKPALLLADEPTSSLNERLALEVVELINKIRKDKNLTVVMVTHDQRVAEVADRLLTLRDGRLAERVGEVVGTEVKPEQRWTENGDLILPDKVKEYLRGAKDIQFALDEKGVWIERVDLIDTNHR